MQLYIVASNINTKKLQNLKYWMYSQENYLKVTKPYDTYWLNPTMNSQDFLDIMQHEVESNIKGIL